MQETGGRNILELEGADKQANTLLTDFKTEVIAANLIEQGYDWSKIQINRVGAAKRLYAKDIEDIRLQFSSHDHSDYLLLQTNREGIYDILPEGLFHQNIKTRHTKDKEDILDEIKIHREEEFFARKFFQLFEVELDRVLVDIALFEAKYDRRISHPNYIKIFFQYWPILKLLEREQAILFLHTIPIIHKIRNNFADIEEALSLILDIPVKIQPVKLLQKETENQFESHLDVHRLGIDFVLGNTFDDGLFDLKVIIGPISAQQMKFFLKTSLGDKLLDQLCALFFPGNYFVVKEYKLLPEDSKFVLSDTEKMTYLGINTFI